MLRSLERTLLRLKEARPGLIALALLCLLAIPAAALLPVHAWVVPAAALAQFSAVVLVTLSLAPGLLTRRGRFEWWNYALGIVGGFIAAFLMAWVLLGD